MSSSAPHSSSKSASTPRSTSHSQAPRSSGALPAPTLPAASSVGHGAEHAISQTASTVTHAGQQVLAKLEELLEYAKSDSGFTLSVSLAILAIVGSNLIKR
ncbi:hypothetical protein RDWZM_008807 [Blomia tropicalis]|uniref:Uncharacterized protein n=1 Tax=Blomia tropicalis TaxID=40697 RepID=A0A9Q0M1W5_BLOTA|nr:hypothetical protein RDWZM_008807 [Blomia tropicalis]